MGLSDILPNGFKSFCWRPYTKVSLDYPCFTWCVFAPTITIASNHNLVKVLSGSSAEAMCIKQISSLATREIGFFVHCPIPIVIFPCPACCFKWHASCRRKANGVLGSPIGFTTGRRASPAWMIVSLQIIQMLSGFQCTYKRKYGRLHLHDETCHSFALFLYLHPGIKVKPGNVTEKCHTGIWWYRGSIMEISVEFVFFPFFYDHPLVA